MQAQMCGESSKQQRCVMCSGVAKVATCRDCGKRVCCAALLRHSGRISTLSMEPQSGGHTGKVEIELHWPDPQVRVFVKAQLRLPEVSTLRITKYQCQVREHGGPHAWG